MCAVSTLRAILFAYSHLFLLVSADFGLKFVGGLALGVCDAWFGRQRWYGGLPHVVNLGAESCPYILFRRLPVASVSRI